MSYGDMYCACLDYQMIHRHLSLPSIVGEDEACMAWRGDIDGYGMVEAIVGGHMSGIGPMEKHRRRR